MTLPSTCGPVHDDNFAASGTVKKVIEINPYLLGTMAGGAGIYLRSYMIQVPF
jgi:hypothetical protein